MPQIRPQKTVTIVRSLDVIPPFASEAEEGAYWQTHALSEELWDTLPPVPEETSATMSLSLSRRAVSVLPRTCREGPGDEDPGACEVAQRVLAHGAATSDAGRRLDGAKELLAKIGAGRSGDRDQLAAYLRAMASLLRDAQVLAAGADAVLANPDARPAVERFAAAYRGERGVRAFTAVDRALEALKANAGFKVLADWVVLQL